MSEEEKSTEVNPAPAIWKGVHVYLMATVCLVLGVAIGYLVRGSQSSAPNAGTATPAIPAPTVTTVAPSEPPTLDQMKQMGDRTAAPLLEKIKKDPNNFEALNEAGKVYRATHQFKQAAEYYQKALKIQPKNAAARTDLASCLYYTGNVDGAIAELNTALGYDPKFYGALFNIGMIKLQSKNDSAGAIAAWEKILRTDADPKLKEMVKKRIADLKQKPSPMAAEPKA